MGLDLTWLPDLPMGQCYHGGREGHREDILCPCSPLVEIFYAEIVMHHRKDTG